MRPNNSVGGYRLYPSSPVDAEMASIATGIIGQFNEGMDRLNRERQLTETQQQVVNNLNPNSQLGRKYQNLISASNDLWQMALEKQQNNNQNIMAGPYTTEELADRLSRCANLWQQMNRRLDEQA